MPLQAARINSEVSTRNTTPDGLGAALAHKGVLTACINYRLAPKYKHPAPVEDTARAVAWVRDNVDFTPRLRRVD